jgi:hypothetical protein
MNEKLAANVSARYAGFAAKEADGRSPLYASLARGVAADRETLDFLLTLPVEKQQPNLLFAALRHVFGTPQDWAGFRRTLLANRESVRQVMLERGTQTNEPNRCAVLLPVLARLPQPLALIEVGASAGLCLLPDFYGYDYGHVQLQPQSPHAASPVFACSASRATPLPTALPEIVWRAGLDLNPLNAADPDQAAWLETLVWPEQTARLANLRSALSIAAAVRPRLVKGDLLGNALERLCAEAPKHATVVVFHTAVLAYVADRSDRAAFASRVQSLCPYWVSNEAPGVFPDAAARTPTRGERGRFLMSVNGSPVAWTEPHGAGLEWITAPD